MLLDKNTPFKREYTFEWLLTFPNESPPEGFEKTMLTRISTMAETVNLPDDEIEFEDYPIGYVNMPVPKGKKFNDITVTYLDDNKDTVYRFHKVLMESIINRNLTCKPMNDFLLSGTYISSDKSIGIDLRSLVDVNITNGKGGLIFDNTLDGFLVQNFPRLFPYKLNRTNANHSGESISKVTVTYRRWVQIKRHPPLITRVTENDWRKGDNIGNQNLK